MVTVGIIGGGQLGLMLAQAGKKIHNDSKIVVVDPTSPTCPALRYADEQIIGKLDDQEAILKLANFNPDVVTIEVEHTNPDAMQALEEQGIPVRPSSKTVRTIQDKFVQYQHLKKHNLPVPKTYELSSPDDLEKLPENKYMLKRRIGSYDGKGNHRYETGDNVNEAFEELQGSIMAQELISFDQEVSVVVARDVKGNLVAFDCVENHHTKKSVLECSIVPARVPKDVQQEAMQIAQKAVDSFQDVGVFAVEMFYTKEQGLCINEIAPRVHNSGHWTMDGITKSSQFEQHMRAILGEPLGSAEQTTPVVMFNILGPANEQEGLLDIAFEENTELKVYKHMYGKPCPKNKQRKVGHINIVEVNPKEDIEELVQQAKKLCTTIKYVPGE